jgi:hypothetical protein
MATAELDGRKQVVFEALRREIERQARPDPARLDLVALAVAIDAALGGDGVMPGDTVDEGKRPEELNAANDG